MNYSGELKRALKIVNVHSREGQQKLFLIFYLKHVCQYYGMTTQYSGGIFYLCLR